MYNIMYMQTKKQVSCGYQDEIELVGTIFFMFYSKCNGKYDW